MRITKPYIGGTLLLLACGGSAPPMPAPLPPVLSTDRVFYSDDTGLRDSVRMVIRDQGTWARVWQQTMQNQPTPPPIPPIDFDREMILVAAAGKMNPGDAIRIDSVGVQGSIVIVVVSIITECDPFSGEAYPMEIVRVTKDDRPVTFRDRRTRAAHCTPAPDARELRRPSAPGEDAVPGRPPSPVERARAARD
jgi:hypothetical protein